MSWYGRRTLKQPFPLEQGAFQALMKHFVSACAKGEFGALGTIEKEEITLTVWDRRSGSR